MGLGKFGKRALVKKRGIFVKTFVISRNVKSDVVKITRSPKFVVAIQITYLCIIRMWCVWPCGYDFWSGIFYITKYVGSKRTGRWPNVPKNVDFV